jgi:hypothetical protein
MRQFLHRLSNAEDMPMHHAADIDQFLVEASAAIQPGDLVEHAFRDLDPREVVSIGRDFLTLDILGEETPRLPKDNYRVVADAEGSL